MSDLFTKYSHKMSSGEVLSGKSRRPWSLHVIHGSALITVEGMQEDRLLYAGDMLAIPPKKLVVVEAERGACRIDIQPAKQPNAGWNPRAWISILARVDAGA